MENDLRRQAENNGKDQESESQSNGEVIVRFMILLIAHAYILACILTLVINLSPIITSLIHLLILAV